MDDSTGKLILLLGALSCVAEQTRANSTGCSNSRACFEYNIGWCAFVSFFAQLSIRSELEAVVKNTTLKAAPASKMNVRFAGVVGLRGDVICSNMSMDQLL